MGNGRRFSGVTVNGARIRTSVKFSSVYVIPERGKHLLLTSVKFQCCLALAKFRKKSDLELPAAGKKEAKSSGIEVCSAVDHFYLRRIVKRKV